MMRDTLRVLAYPVRGLQAAVYVLAASAFLSSLLALVRDRLFAHTFGAGSELDLYYAAFRLPDLLFVATSSLVSVYILIPELARRSKADERAYIDTIMLGFSFFAAVLSIVAGIFAPAILGVLFPQFEQAGFLSALTDLTRIMLFQPFLLGLSNILAAITQARRRYLLYSVSPILYNVGIIAGLLVFYPLFGFSGLAWGVVCGAFLHMIIQLPPIIREGFFTKLPKFAEPRALLETFAISVPRTLALSASQISFLGLSALASSLTAGSLAVFTLGYNLMSVPLGVVGASYSVAAFPTLASALAKGRTHEFIEHVATAARYVLFWSLPAIALIAVLRAHIVRVILGSGSFDWTDTRLTAAIFALLALSLAAQGLTLLLTRAYYAAGRTFVPFVIAALSAVCTIAAAFLFLGAFSHSGLAHLLQVLLRLEDVPGSSVLALALAYSLVSIGSCIALVLHFEGRFGGLYERIRTTLWQGALASLASGSATYATLAAMGPLSLSPTLVSIFTRGFIAGVAGIFVASLVYLLLKNEEYLETASSVRARLWRTPLPESQALASLEEGAGSTLP